MSKDFPLGGVVALTLLAGVAIGALVRDRQLAPEAVVTPAPPSPAPEAAARSAPLSVVAPPHPRPTVARAATDPPRSAAGQQLDAVPDDARRALESRLLSEPVSAGWAMANEARIGDALAAGLRTEALDPPLHQRIECRSTLCRVDVVMADEYELELAQIHLLHGIADGLGSARLFRETRDDGTVALVAYAHATPR